MAGAGVVKNSNVNGAVQICTISAVRDLTMNPGTYALLRVNTMIETTKHFLSNKVDLMDPVTGDMVVMPVQLYNQMSASQGLPDDQIFREISSIHGMV